MTSEVTRNQTYAMWLILLAIFVLLFRYSANHPATELKTSTSCPGTCKAGDVCEVFETRQLFHCQDGDWKETGTP